jgi:hypothetical protein
MCNLVCDVAFVVEYVLCMCGLGRHVVPTERRSPQKRIVTLQNLDVSYVHLICLKKSKSNGSRIKNTMLQETRPTHGGTRETMEITLDDESGIAAFCCSNPEARSGGAPRGMCKRPNHPLRVTYLRMSQESYLPL